MRSFRARSTPSQRGSFIIEAMISLLLFAIAIIGLVGLSAKALNQIGQSKSRNDASFIAGELIAQMWVSDNVNISSWKSRLQTAVPGAAADVYFSSCTCGSCAGTAQTGTSVAVPKQQAVTVCITWADRKDPDYPRRYSTSSMISRN